mgnify:CR=1 FL=1
MAEYIEREALLQDIEETVCFTVKAGTISNEMRGANKIIDRIKCAPAVDVVPLALLEKWLYEIAFNNLGTGSQKDAAFAESCEEIINRLDGLRAFIRDEANN